MQVVLCLFLAFISSITTVVAIQRCRNNQFLSDTFGLVWMGVFVWGDALVLAPFWFISSLVFMWLPWISILRWILVFWIFREAYEVVYWLNHQASKSPYRPPFVRRFTWLTAEHGAILYQLFAMCQVVVYVLGLLATYQLL